MTTARTVLVVGGSGFVGRHLVARLCAAGHRVVVPTRRREQARHLITLPTIDVVEADVHDAATLQALVRRADAVVNLTGIIHESAHATFARVHAELPARIVGACRAAGVRRLVHMSSLNAAPDAPSAYLRSKGEAEAAVAASGLDWTIFRPSVIFGRGDAFLNLFARLLRWVPVVALAGAQARFQPVHVGDVAHCFAHALDDDATVGARYDLCGPRVYTLRELVRWVGETTGAVRPIVPLGAGLGRLQAFVLERLPGKLVTRDNLDSMRVDSVCDCPFPAVFGIAPAAVEAIAPAYLAPESLRGPYGEYRAQGGR